MKKKTNKLNVYENEIINLIHWARRYCDYRMTFAPTTFNQVYDNIMDRNPHLREQDKFDSILMEDGKFFPYAQDGMYPQIDATPRKKA